MAQVVARDDPLRFVGEHLRSGQHITFTAPTVMLPTTAVTVLAAHVAVAADHFHHPAVLEGHKIRAVAAVAMHHCLVKVEGRYGYSSYQAIL